MKKKNVYKETLESPQFKEFFDSVPKEHKRSVLETVLGICAEHQKIVNQIENLSPEEKQKIILELLNVKQ